MERRAHGEAALKGFDGWLVKPVRAASLIARLDPAARTPAQVLASQPAPTLAGLTALLAEDNEINALIALRQLEALGAAPTRAEDGEDVVALAQAAIDGKIRRFDVILMDLFMPKLDGLDATRRIRSAETRAGAPRTPILALTASASREDAEAARAAGADAVLTKPVELAALQEAIRALSAGVAPSSLRFGRRAPRHKSFVWRWSSSRRKPRAALALDLARSGDAAAFPLARKTR